MANSIYIGAGAAPAVTAQGATASMARLLRNVQAFNCAYSNGVALSRLRYAHLERVAQSPLREYRTCYYLVTLNRRRYYMRTAGAAALLYARLSGLTLTR